LATNFARFRSLRFLLKERQGLSSRIDRAVEAVGKIGPISRARCRREFEQGLPIVKWLRITSIYKQLLSRSSAEAAA